MILIGFIAYRLFDTGLYQPSVIKRGSVTAASETYRGQKVTAQTRLAVVGRGSFWQVEVSPDNWQDCGTDCAAVLRHFAFHE